MALTDSLIAAWELDEASGARVDSHGNNDLTDNNTVGSGTGIVHATAADFENDNSEYLSIADNTDLSMGDIDLTIEMWIKPEVIGASDTPLAKDNGTQREYGFYFSNTSPEAIRFYVFGTAGDFTEVVSGSELSNGNWYQVIAKHKATANVIGIKINNGTEVTAAHTEGVRDSTAAFVLGALSSGASQFYDGLMGPVRIWKRLTTDDEDTELYNAGAGLAYADFGGGEEFNPLLLFASDMRGGMAAMTGGMRG